MQSGIYFNVAKLKTQKTESLTVFRFANTTRE